MSITGVCPCPNYLVYRPVLFLEAGIIFFLIRQADDGKLILNCNVCWQSGTIRALRGRQVTLELLGHGELSVIQVSFYLLTTPTCHF